MAETTTTLTRLLNESKGKRKELLDKKDYAGAQQLRTSMFEQAASQKSKIDSSIRDRQEIERRRLEVAKGIAIKKIHDAVTEEVEANDIEMELQREHLLLKQAERLDQFRGRVESREAQKPMVMSSYVRDLQRSEKQLAALHMYDECAIVRRKIKDQEVHERRRLDHERTDRIDAAMEMKKKQFEGDEGFLKARAKNLHQLAIFRAQQEEARVKHQFEHIEKDMAHAHKRELQNNPLLKQYEKPKFIRHSAKDEKATSATNRGTTYLLRMQGSRYNIPSLCELYGDKLDGGSAGRFAASVNDHNHWHNAASASSRRAASTRSRKNNTLSNTTPSLPSVKKPSTAVGRSRFS